MASSENDVDVCVIGSGVAGMLVAERLLAAGREVTMIERGLPLTVRERLAKGSHDDGLVYNRRPHRSPHVTDPSQNYVFSPVYTLGGATNHFYGNTPRFHPAHFDADAFGGLARRWPIRYADIEPYYLEVERRLGISGNDERTPFAGRFAYPVAPHRLSPSDRACETIFGAANVMQVPTVRPSHDVNGRPRCCATNRCGLCPIDSKGTALNTLYPAIRDRVRLRSGLLATELRVADRRVDAIVLQDPQGRSTIVRARHVIVACNGVESALLLQRSPGVPRHALLGRCYMDHPAFDVAIFGSGLDARPGYGDSAQTGMVTMFFAEVGRDLPVSLLGEIKSGELSKSAGEANRDRAVRFVVGDALARRFSTAASLRQRIDEDFRAIVYLRFLVETQPLPENTVGIDRIEPSGQAIPRVRLAYPSYFGACIERVRAFVQARLPKAEVRHLSSGTGVQHWMGATRMSDTPGTGCVDRDLRYHGLANLFVLSASVFPSGSSANPTLTVGALALRLGDHLTR